MHPPHWRTHLLSLGLSSSLLERGWETLLAAFPPFQLEPPQVPQRTQGVFQPFCNAPPKKTRIVVSSLCHFHVHNSSSLMGSFTWAPHGKQMDQTGNWNYQALTMLAWAAQQTALPTPAALETQSWALTSALSARTPCIALSCSYRKSQLQLRPHSTWSFLTITPLHPLLHRHLDGSWHLPWRSNGCWCSKLCEYQATATWSKQPGDRFASSTDGRCPSDNSEAAFWSIATGCNPIFLAVMVCAVLCMRVRE